MLHRHRGDALFLISQPAHAWISGQIAAAWGNSGLGLLPASRELQIAAEQHDIAWFNWEQAPTLNPERGLPYAFNELPTAEHLELWRTATPRALVYGRLPALLISMHGTYLYRRFHDFERDSTEEAILAREFLEHEERQQEALLEHVRRRCDISQSQVNHNRTLLSLWDAMSLALCMGFDGSRTFDNVPVTNGQIEMRVDSRCPNSDGYSVDPWPFQTNQVELGCEMRVLDESYTDQSSMRAAVRDAKAKQLRIRLAPA